MSDLVELHDYQIDTLLDDAHAGDRESINLVIEPIGNDDNVTAAFVSLMWQVRRDACEQIGHHRYSETVCKLRNNSRMDALHKFVTLCDEYYASVFDERV